MCLLFLKKATQKSDEEIMHKRVCFGFWWAVVVFMSFLGVLPEQARGELEGCIVGNLGRGENDARRRLVNRLAAPKEDDVLIHAFRNWKNASQQQQTSVVGIEEDCRCSPNRDVTPLAIQIGGLQALAEFRSFDASQNAPRIKRECIAGTMKNLRNFTSGQMLYCPNDMSSTRNGTRFRGGNNTPCVNEDFVDYVHWATNEALDCMFSLVEQIRGPLSDEEKRVDVMAALRKINHETKFTPFISHDAGRGMTQMTSIAIKEMYPPHAGQAYLNALQATNHPSCRPFKEIIGAGDSTRDPRDPCRLVDVGRGLARSLFFGLAYYQHMKTTAGDRSARARLRGKEDMLQLEADIALAFFGPGSENRVSSAARSALSTQRNEEGYRRALRSNLGRNSYLSRLDRDLDALVESLELTDGGDCVEQ